MFADLTIVKQDKTRLGGELVFVLYIPFVIPSSSKRLLQQEDLNS